MAKKVKTVTKPKSKSKKTSTKKKPVVPKSKIQTTSQPKVGFFSRLVKLFGF